MPGDLQLIKLLRLLFPTIRISTEGYWSKGTLFTFLQRSKLVDKLNATISFALRSTLPLLLIVAAQFCDDNHCTQNKLFAHNFNCEYLLKIYERIKLCHEIIFTCGGKATQEFQQRSNRHIKK